MSRVEKDAIHPVAYPGTADINVTDLESHPLQRPIDSSFVDELAHGLSNDVKPRWSHRISVVFKEEPPEVIKQSLLLGKPIEIPSNLVQVIDGQHRVAALKTRLKKDDATIESPIWPAIVYPEGMLHFDQSYLQVECL
jgi:hypothetical protein